jgi:hypothetical protein
MNLSRSISLSALLWAGIAQPSFADPLSEGFLEPPKESRPETWFHLIGGNVAKPGLTTDLEAIASAGLSGIQLFHGDGKAWPGVEPQIPCLSPQWDEMISHIANECQRLGLRFTMQNCPGWSMSGGPWIKPDKAMRHLVWSRTDASGGEEIQLSLPKPQPSNEDWRDYREVAVIAFPTPLGDDGNFLLPISGRSNREKEPVDELVTGKLSGTKLQLNPADGQAWIEIDFAKPITLRSIELPPVMKMANPRNFDPGLTIRVEVLSDGKWLEVANREIPRGNWKDKKSSLTFALPETTGTTYRLLLNLKSPITLESLKFSSAAKIDNWEGQAGHTLRSLDYQPLPKQNPLAWVASDKIVDLSNNLNADGELKWTPPPGKWTIMRFGNITADERNYPAPKEATGFECDKLSAAGADQHFEGYIGRISGQNGPADRGRLQGVLLDSWECGFQTWTPAMEQEFLTRRGYELRKWLPALAGYVVDDHARSGRLLRDWRATINDLLVQNYFGRMATLAHELGMKVSYEAAIGDVSPGDILQYYGKADIPMCEFWQPNDPHWGGLETKPIAPTVSAAHLYGKNRIAAEAFTSLELSWDEHPFMLKHLADRHMTYGINYLVFHTYTHNPRLDVTPGTSFGQGIGTPFIRNQTWWKYMPEFTTYLARCQFMLEQGKPVADVLWFLGDDLDHKPRQDTSFADGFQFDYMNLDALMNRIKLVDGKLTTPDGLAWKILWLPKCPQMTPETLARIRELLHAGAIVVGPPPLQNSSLQGGNEADARFAALIEELWGKNPAAKGDQKVGAGRLIWGMDIGDALNHVKVDPDVIGASSATWCHRRTDDSEIYFIASAHDQELDANLGFRAIGRPEFWDPLTGLSRPVPVSNRRGNHTFIPVKLPAAGSVFVVFRKGEPGPQVTCVERDGKVPIDATDLARIDHGTPPRIQGLRKGEPVQPWVANVMANCEVIDGGSKLLAWEPGRYRVLSGEKVLLDTNVSLPQQIAAAGPWRLAFPNGWDIPESIDLPELKFWSDLEPPAARAFSGTATYTCELAVPALAPDQRAMLDLGEVANIAEVAVNGKKVSVLWTAPFRADITAFLKPGENKIAVTVTNTWRNRLAYDSSLPEDQRKTWTIAGPTADVRRENAGLKGPVILSVGSTIPIPRK